MSVFIIYTVIWMFKFVLRDTGFLIVLLIQHYFSSTRTSVCVG